LNLVADENIDRQVVERLRVEGHDVATSWEAAPGVEDDQVLELARARAAVLITADKDFGELVFRQERAFFGVLLIRLPGMCSEERADRIALVVATHANELGGAFTVVTRTSTRIRRRR
jgi:predicted nuclease of predicted toxin-antitoxin system